MTIKVTGLMYPAVIESLKKLDICPECGVSWTELEKMLHEPINSSNYWVARYVILMNCTVCKVRFQNERD